MRASRSRVGRVVEEWSLRRYGTRAAGSIVGVGLGGVIGGLIGVLLAALQGGKLRTGISYVVMGAVLIGIVEVVDAYRRRGGRNAWEP